MRYVKTFLWLLFVPLIWSCSSMYPIDHRLIETEQDQDFGYEMDIDPSNFYQLRISESLGFLPIKEGINSRTVVSDLPYRRFRQDTLMQDPHSTRADLTVEETYLYLDGLNLSNPERVQNQHGYLIYFVTYAAVDGSRSKNKRLKSSKAKKYFNDATKLYINVIRDVAIGYWMKNSDNDLLFMVRNDNGQLDIHRGRAYPDRIGLSELSHPSFENERLESLQKLQKVVSEMGISRDPTRQTQKTIDQEDLDMLFDRIYSSVALIELKNVFSLNNQEELLFINIPEGKEFVFEEEGPGQTFQFHTIKSFMLRKPRLFVNTQKSGGNTVYEFSPKNLRFTTPD